MVDLISREQKPLLSHFNFLNSPVVPCLYHGLLSIGIYTELPDDVIYQKVVLAQVWKKQIAFGCLFKKILYAHIFVKNPLPAGPIYQWPSR